MIILLDLERMVDKNQHSFMINKILSKIGIEENLSSQYDKFQP